MLATTLWKTKSLSGNNKLIYLFVKKSDRRKSGDEEREMEGTKKLQRGRGMRTREGKEETRECMKGEKKEESERGRGACKIYKEERGRRTCSGKKQEIQERRDDEGDVKAAKKESIEESVNGRRAMTGRLSFLLYHPPTVAVMPYVFLFF